MQYLTCTVQICSVLLKIERAMRNGCIERVLAASETAVHTDKVNRPAFFVGHALSLRFPPCRRLLTRPLWCAHVLLTGGLFLDMFLPFCVFLGLPFFYSLSTTCSLFLSLLLCQPSCTSSRRLLDTRRFNKLGIATTATAVGPVVHLWVPAC